MRPSRKFLIPNDSGLVHKIWRAHNKDHLLKLHVDKEKYIGLISDTISKAHFKNNITMYAFCIMNNHAHELVQYTDAREILSKFMQNLHSRFGIYYNKINSRIGPVAYDRPKTPLVEPNSAHAMRVHFYIEANPLRAGIVKDLRNYKYSSYQFYAYGKINQFTKFLTPPRWYLELGKTALARQKKYRALFQKYLSSTIKRTPFYSHAKWIGSSKWLQITFGMLAQIPKVTQMNTYRMNQEFANRFTPS